MDPVAFDAGYEELMVQQTCLDWPTKLQYFVEQLWHSRAPAWTDDALIERMPPLVRMLSQRDAFEIVSNVIPEFRQAGPDLEQLSPLQTRILTALDTIHRDFTRERSLGQADFDTPYYRHEKTVAQESDFHRAAILLCGAANVDFEQERAIWAWLDQAPIRNSPANPPQAVSYPTLPHYDSSSATPSPTPAPRP